MMACKREFLSENLTFLLFTIFLGGGSAFGEVASKES